MHTYGGDILLVQDDFSSDDSENEMGNNVMDAFDPGCETGTCYCNIQPTVRDGRAGGAFEEDDILFCFSICSYSREYWLILGEIVDILTPDVRQC